MLDEADEKAKNVRQTELLVDLREAILQISRHFQALDPKNSRYVSPPSPSPLPSVNRAPAITSSHVVHIACMWRFAKIFSY